MATPPPPQSQIVSIMSRGTLSRDTLVTAEPPTEMEHPILAEMEHPILAAFQRQEGEWSDCPEMLLEGYDSKERWELHADATALGLFTHSTGPAHARVLHVWRDKPAGWKPFAPKQRQTRAPAYHDWLDDWEFIGDCSECGVELWSRQEVEDDEGEEMFCQCVCRGGGWPGGSTITLTPPCPVTSRRCGGDCVSKWELMGCRRY